MVFMTKVMIVTTPDSWLEFLAMQIWFNVNMMWMKASAFHSEVSDNDQRSAFDFATTKKSYKFACIWRFRMICVPISSWIQYP